MKTAHDTGVSIVIPVLGDTARLARLLDRLDGGSPAQSGPPEYVVVDGAADKTCRRLCEARGCRYITTRAGRGHQLHAGAAAARGEVLWFLHADTEPPGDALDRIDEAIQDGAVGGWFRFCFAGESSAGRRFLEACINWRSRIGIPYGDQGLFVRRDVYDDIGGFPDLPLFEEVPVVRGARRRGRFMPLDSAIGVSPRRWDRDGWVRRTAANRALALGHALGLHPRRLARHYPGPDRRSRGS